VLVHRAAGVRLPLLRLLPVPLEQYLPLPPPLPQTPAALRHPSAPPPPLVLALGVPRPPRRAAPPHSPPPPPAHGQ